MNWNSLNPRHKINGLRHRLALLKAMPASLSRLEQLELQMAAVAGFKSKVELGGGSIEPPMVEEFAHWKSENPIPTQPLVSVCVATYNRAELLVTRCLPSILSQTYANIEVIVVGDCCTDGTSEKVAQINDPRLRFLNLGTRGHYPEDRELRWMVAGTVPVNTALAMARGDFIAHLDDDDAYLPERIEKLVQCALQNQVDFVWHPFWAQTLQGEWFLNEALECRWGAVTTSSIFYRSWLGRIGWDLYCYRQNEPGDWNRIRKMLYLEPKKMRLPEPLLRHFAEKSQ